jgi:pimeloyl-ACP methyl ester carboxylesterase
MFRLTLALFALFTAPAQAADQSTCEMVEGARPYGYCITTSPESKNQDVLYVFHGGGGDIKGDWWITDPALDGIKEIFRKSSYGMPRVIEVSFGPIWVLAPKGKSPRSGLLELFTDEIMPKLEAKLTGKLGHRKMLGHSMGGLNAALLVLHRPDLFKSAALLAPAFIGVSPFAGDEAHAAYEKSRGMQPGWTKNLMNTARAFVADEQEWQDFSPTIVAPDALSPDSPDLLVSAGPEDPMFYEEARIFAEQAKKAGTWTVWDKHEHGHGFVNSRVIASFLSLPF